MATKTLNICVKRKKNNTIVAIVQEGDISLFVDDELEIKITMHKIQSENVLLIFKFTDTESDLPSNPFMGFGSCYVFEFAKQATATDDVTNFSARKIIPRWPIAAGGELIWSSSCNVLLLGENGVSSSNSLVPVIGTDEIENEPCLPNFTVKVR